MRIALFGFPLTGKSTVFSLLTGVEHAAHTARGEVSIGIAKVPDPRLDHLSSIYRPKKHTPATVEYLDLAGIEKGEAATALPLDKLRNADALAHVVRAFRDESVHHVEDSIDPLRDFETMETELLLADHTVAQRRVEKLEELIRKKNRDEEIRELELLRDCLAALERGVPLRNLELSDDQRRRVRGFAFLTMKPLLVIVNADEADVEMVDRGADAFGLSELAGRPEVEVVAMSAKIESELAHLEPAFAEALRADLRITEPALDRVIRASYRLLGSISLFTVGEDECRAWTIRRGMNARASAGAVHSDIERGFIRAAVVAYDDLAAAGSWSACRDNGTVRVEGKDYVVRDGDVVDFRFNI
jgi:GTP-binding protein YchF